MKRTMLFKWLLLLSGLHICALVSADTKRIRILSFLRHFIGGVLGRTQTIMLLFLVLCISDKIVAQNTSVEVETHHGTQEMKVFEETPKSLFFSEMTFNASQVSSGINDFNVENIRHPRMLEIMYNDSSSLNNCSIKIFESDGTSPLGSIDLELHDSSNNKKNELAKGISSSVIATIPISNINCSDGPDCNTAYNSGMDNYGIIAFDLEEQIDELSNYNPCTNCNKIFGIGIYDDIAESLVDFVSFGYGLFIDENNEYVRSSVIQSDKRSYYVFDSTDCSTSNVCFDEDLDNDDCKECDYIMAETVSGPIESIKLTDEGWEKYPSPESMGVFNTDLNTFSTANFSLKYQHPAVGLVQTLPFTYTFFDLDFNIQPLKVSDNTTGAWADNYEFWNYYNGAEPYIEYSFLYYPYTSEQLMRYNTDALTTHFGLHNVIDYYWDTFAYSEWEEKPVFLHYSPEWYFLKDWFDNPTMGKLLEEDEEWDRSADWRLSNPYSIASAGATLDIVAHEMGHRFNSDHMMLSQSWINEGLADVWSNLIEARTMDPNEDNPSYPDYDLRNRNNTDINLVRSFSYKAYNTTSFTNGCNVYPNHCRGRVVSHWYRLLTEGGSATKNFTSACNGDLISFNYDIEPISISDFEQLFYQAFEIARDNPDFNRMGSGDIDRADIFEIRDATIKAAEIMFPNDLSVKRRVIDAWRAVNVLRQCDTEVYVSPTSSLVLLEDNDIDTGDIAIMGEDVNHTIYVLEGETLTIDDGVILNFVDGHDISVESGGTLIIKNATVSFSEGSEIIVYNGGKLVVDGSTLTNLSDDNNAGKWDGITILGNGGGFIAPSLLDISNDNYPTSSSDHGLIIVKGGSEIKNAQIGINAPATCYVEDISTGDLLPITNGLGELRDYRGGIIICDNDVDFGNQTNLDFQDINNNTTNFNKFTDNDVSIRVNQLWDSNTPISNVSYIQNTIFENSEKDHIHLYYVNDGFSIENSIFQGANNNVNAMIGSAAISGAASSIEVSNNYFSGFHYGIVGDNSSCLLSDAGGCIPNTGLTVNNNYFVDTNKGITDLGSYLSIYQNNQFHTPNNEVFVTQDATIINIIEAMETLNNLETAANSSESELQAILGNWMSIAVQYDDSTIDNITINNIKYDTNIPYTPGFGLDLNELIGLSDQLAEENAEFEQVGENAYGVFTHSIANASILNNSFADNDLNNTVTNNQFITGVKSVNTDLNCISNNFNSLTKGVDIYNINAAFQATIEDNTIDNTLKGITANTTPFAIIKGNTITVPNSLSETEYDAYGIWMDNCAGFSIEDNVINTNITVSDYANGIIIDDSNMLGAGGSRIVNNLFEGAFSNASYIRGNNNGLQFDCNNYHACQTDWYIAENALLGQQGANVSDPNPIPFRQSWHDATNGGMHIINDSNTAILLFASDESSKPDPLLIDGAVSINDGIQVEESNVECGENYDAMIEIVTTIDGNGNPIDCIAPSVDTYQSTSQAVRGNLRNDQVVCAEGILESQSENWSDWVLVATYISTRDYTRAEQKMDNINVITTEDQQLYDLYSAMISVIQNGGSAGKASIIETIISPKLAKNHSQTVKSLAEAAMAHLKNESQLRSVRHKSTNSSDALYFVDMMLTAYPNPTNSSLNISWDKVDDSNPISLTITDLYGKVIEQYLIEENTYSQIVNLEKVSNGIYFCYLEDQNGQRSATTKVFVID